MNYVTIKSWDIPDAWFQALWRIWIEGDIFKVGYGSEETETKKLNLSIEITHPENRPLINDKAPCDMKYVNEYFATYLWFPKDETNTSSYTYGDRLRKPIDQLDLAIERLITEPNDRQVTLVVRRPDDICKFLGEKKHEPPCLTMIDLEILNNELHTTAYFRSWDCYGGLPANIAGIQLLAEQIVKDINETGQYPFGELKTGKLILHSKNCHIYKRCYPMVEELFYPKKCERCKL